MGTGTEAKIMHLMRCHVVTTIFNNKLLYEYSVVIYDDLPGLFCFIIKTIKIIYLFPKYESRG